MQISLGNLLMPAQLLPAKANAGIAGIALDGGETASSSTITRTPATSSTVSQTSAMPSPAESAFAATLAVHSLSPEQVPSYLSTVPVAGLGSPAFQYAGAHGGINPAEWLSPSDISLFEKATGGTIKDGVIYDKNGNENTNQGVTDLVCALCDMRNMGTFSANGQPQLVQGAITANDMQGFIARYKDNKGAFDMGILNSALDTLTKQQA